MRKTAVFACALLLIALVIAVGSQTFFSPCVHEDGSAGVCRDAGQAALGLGCLLAAQALLALLQKKPAARAGVFLAMAPTALLGVLTPGTLLPLCKMSVMRCRAVMQPALILLFVLALLIALIAWLLARRQSK